MKRKDEFACLDCGGDTPLATHRREEFLWRWELCGSCMVTKLHLQMSIIENYANSGTSQ